VPVRLAQGVVEAVAAAAPVAARASNAVARDTGRATVASDVVIHRMMVPCMPPCGCAVEGGASALGDGSRVHGL
jgi:hypothetical protein